MTGVYFCTDYRQGRVGIPDGSSAVGDTCSLATETTNSFRQNNDTCIPAMLILFCLLKSSTEGTCFFNY